MKKKILLIFFGIMVLVLAACNFSSENQAEGSFTGTVEEINEDSALVAIEDGEILSSGDQVVVDLSKAEENIEVGDQVRVGYDGGVMESYPLQISTVFVEKIE